MHCRIAKCRKRPCQTFICTAPIHLSFQIVCLIIIYKQNFQKVASSSRRPNMQTQTQTPTTATALNSQAFLAPMAQLQGCLPLPCRCPSPRISEFDPPTRSKSDESPASTTTPTPIFVCDWRKLCDIVMVQILCSTASPVNSIIHRNSSPKSGYQVQLSRSR